MFLPVDDEEIDGEILKKFGKGGFKKLREKEKREAAKGVRDALAHWIGGFFLFLGFFFSGVVWRGTLGLMGGTRDEYGTGRIKNRAFVGRTVWSGDV